MIGFTADGKSIYSGPAWPSRVRHEITWLPGPNDGRSLLRRANRPLFDDMATDWSGICVNRADGLALVPADEGEDSALADLDLTTGHREVVSWPLPKPIFFGPGAGISRTADGRYLVYVLREVAKVETWWSDCDAKRRCHFPD